MTTLPDETARLDATGQADLVRSGQCKPVELVEAAIRRIEALNGDLNAVIVRHFERALDEAAGELPDGPFRGVPFLLKDLACGNRKGDPIYWGTRFLRDADYRAPTTSHLVQRFMDAGLVIVGRTNVPELGAWTTTEPASFGPTRNPWNPEHSCGGSSGGAAAAVASGMVPLAHGSDGGGSIRNPASQSGLVGLKPTRGRISLGPDIGEAWAGLTFEFALSRSVRDTAALLDAVAGNVQGDPYFAPPPSVPYASVIDERPPALRVGFWTEPGPGEAAPAPACVEAVERATRALLGLGHRVESARPAALGDPELAGSALRVIAASQAHDMERFGRALGRSLGSDDVDVDNWAVAEIGRQVTASDYIEAETQLQAFARRVLSWWTGGFDLLVTPTIGEPPPRLGQLVPNPDKPLEGFLRSGQLTHYLIPFNITGQPAISLPLHWNEAGLPIGVQLVAAFGREDLLLQVAAQLEEALPWGDRRPRIHA